MGLLLPIQEYRLNLLVVLPLRPVRKKKVQLPMIQLSLTEQLDDLVHVGDVDLEGDLEPRMKPPGVPELLGKGTTEKCSPYS